MALLFWVLGALVLFVPFLGKRSAPDPEGDDPARADSEVDYPFDEDVAYYEEEFGFELMPTIAEASERYFAPDSPSLKESGMVQVERLEAGQVAYARYCQGCHGVSGDGGGPAARHLDPRPRNFRRGIFKFTSTPTGSPPLPQDVFRTITRGLGGSSMPDFRLLNEERRWDLVEYVRYLAIRGSFEQLMLDLAWDEEEVPDPEDAYRIVARRWDPERAKAVYPPIPEPSADEGTVANGRELFVSATGAGCAACHGDGGKGDGPSAGDFKDEWGYHIVPRDLTEGAFRAGAGAEDLYRSIATGINGTPMPSYEGSNSPEEIWALVHYIESLREE